MEDEERPAEESAQTTTVAGAKVGAKPSAAPAVAPGESIGRYIVESCIAGGGMGVVYRARDPELNRAVAIKLLQPDYANEAPEIASLRLLREAQALARITHPNVIAVHDVGRFRDSIFVAMELIDGRTLMEWLNEKRRTTREILHVFRDAARALAATHRVGLVHRDFKPTNVMVGRDGRVCVLDFGLARDQHGDPAPTEPSSTTTPRPERPSSEDSLSDSFSSSDSSELLRSGQLTSAGQILGTPAFMAPEQHRGEQVDAKADQFSFCTSLYWALAGRLPFDTGKKRPLSAAKHTGRVQPLPSRVRLPRRVRRMIWRGLSTLPDERSPSMDAVVRELDLALRPKGLVVAAAAVMVLLPILAVVGLRERRTAGMCRGLDAEMNSVWNPSARQALHTRLLATGRANAATTFDRVAHALDDYTGEWTKIRVEACEATHVRGVQSAQLLDLRMSCLGRARGQVSALLAVMIEHADGSMIDQAVGATLALPRLSSCTDPAILSAAVPPPDDPQVRAQVDALTSRMASVQALRDTGRYSDGLVAARDLVQQADALQHAPTQAGAKLLLGSLQEEAGDFALARATLSAAAKNAATAKDDALAVRIWTRLYKVIAASQVNAKDADLVLPIAEATLLRIGRPPLFEADLLANQGAAALQAGDYVAAEKIHRHALELIERSGSEADALLPLFRSSLAAAIASQGRADEARPVFERARVEEERIYGPEHPLVGKLLTQLGLLYSRSGENELSLVTLQRALAILEHTVGPNSPGVATVLVDLANTFEALRRIEDAILAQRRAVEIWSRPGAPENPDLCYAQQGLANSLTLHSDFDEAWPIAQQALARFEATYGPNHFDTSYAQELLGELLYRRGHPREAEEHFRRVFEIRRKGSGDPLEAAKSLFRVAEVQEHRGQRDGALATLGEVLKQSRIDPATQHQEGAPSQSAGQQHLLLRVLELRSTIRLAQHRRDDALADARQALALAPSITSPSDRAWANAELQLRIAQLANEDSQAAMLTFERAIQELSPRNPDLPGVLIELADAHLKASDRARAAQLLERAIGLPALTQGAPEDRARAHFLLARAYAAQPARASELARQAQALYAKAEAGVATEDRRALARFIATGH